MKPLSVQAYVDGVLGRDRAVLARAITLVESEQPRHAELAQEMLRQVLPQTGGAHRVGVSGVPGAGKSTFIDAFGTMLTSEGKRVAVLAVDPSSAVSGGSILGDKTRMSELARDPNAFIRPSPSSGTLGGVAQKTRETLLLCEAAGFDVVLVETVGVGQSEAVVAEMVDFFLVLMIAGAGDQLQGIKRGILEVADMLAINKADGDNALRAKNARSSYAAALKLMRGSGALWDPPVVTCSALETSGLEDIWTNITEHRETLDRAGALRERRQAQQVRWMWSMIEEQLMNSFRHDAVIKPLLSELEREVRTGELTATAAAQRALQKWSTRS